MPLSQKQIAAGKQPTEEVIHIKGREEISQAKRQKKARLESEKGKKIAKAKDKDVENIIPLPRTMQVLQAPWG